MAARVALYTIPEPSTAFVSEVSLNEVGGTLTLMYDYDRDGDVFRAGLRFGGVRAHDNRAEGHCTAADIRGAYDTLAEVEESPWLAALRDAQSRPAIPWEMHHYTIFLDSAGCFNIAAATWEPLPEERVAPGS